MARILYIVSHPIQYQAPFLRLISQSSDMTIRTLFYWNRPAKVHFDEGFGCEVTWDIPLLSGYTHHFLSELAGGTNRYKKMVALWRAIDAKKLDAVWTHGYADAYTLAAIVMSKLKGLEVFVRGDSALFPDAKETKFKYMKRKILLKILNLVVNRFLSVGTSNTEFYTHFGVPKKKITVCHYAVDNNFFRQKYLSSKNKMMNLKRSLNLESNRAVILYAGKFIERKFPIDLLNAYFMMCEHLQAPKPYLLYIGTGETFDDVKKESAVDLEHIRFLGFKNQSELPDYFSITDIFVLPAIHENWGLIVNEVMNADCALVLTDHIACASDLVQIGENGFIYPARDIQKLSECLKQLVEDRLLCEKMKKKSGEIIANWGLQESLDGLREACRLLLENR